MKTIICDIDGTIAKKSNRSPYHWDKVNEDTPIYPIINIIEHYNMTHIIILLSGRDSCCREETKKWLNKYDILYDLLLMRSEKDNRKDCIIKEELYNKYIKDKYKVDFVLDDRNQVVKMWRDIGLTCLQVADGNF